MIVLIISLGTAKLEIITKCRYFSISLMPAYIFMQLAIKNRRKSGLTEEPA
jgi:hypothetical protein